MKSDLSHWGSIMESNHFNPDRFFERCQVVLKITCQRDCDESCKKIKKLRN